MRSLEGKNYLELVLAQHSLEALQYGTSCLPLGVWRDMCNSMHLVAGTQTQCKCAETMKVNYIPRHQQQQQLYSNSSRTLADCLLLREFYMKFIKKYHLTARCSNSMLEIFIRYAALSAYGIRALWQFSENNFRGHSYSPVCGIYGRTN